MKFIALIISAALATGCANMLESPEGTTDVGKMITGGGTIKLIRVQRPTGYTGAMYISDQYGINTNYISMPPSKLRELKSLIEQTLVSIEAKN
jgi:hypothetical protein